MALKKADLEKSLRGKFGFETVAGDRHPSIALFVGGKKVAKTMFSHGHTEISDAILTMISRQLGVNLGQLKRMYGCTISKDEYVEILRQTGWLD